MNTVNEDHKTIHESVSKTYTTVLKDTPSTKPTSVKTKLAKYDDDDLLNIPVDAVENSFGCGNPLAFAGVKAGDTVIDLGSGAGIDLLIAAEKVGDEGRVIGIDMTDAMIEKARANIANANVNNVEVRKGVIENLPVEDSSVDWVISNCVINLSPDKKSVFSEINRVLKPGGKMQVSDIVMEPDTLPDWIKNNEQLYNACVAGAIAEKDYLAGLEQAGLTNVKVVDRMIFDASTIKGLVKSGEVPEVVELLDTLGDQADILVDQLIQQIEGKVWSAKIYAEKPRTL